MSIRIDLLSCELLVLRCFFFLNPGSKSMDGGRCSEDRRFRKDSWRASAAVGLSPGSNLSRLDTKSLASGEMSFHARALKLYSHPDIFRMSSLMLLSLLNGLVLLRSMNAMTPTDQMSAMFVYTPRSTCGLMKWTVPAHLLSTSPLRYFLLSPKSMILISESQLVLSNIMFSYLRSRCITFLLCMYATAESSCWRIRAASISE
mmetsp:Transcript_8594/g.17614  ORF Transcript_8594/g.17614 Transcript_8594/m.17614 type:complete len:203 (+) Transcript_8594:809-1417(+)